MSDLATVGINVVLQGQQQAIAGLNQVAAAADNKVSPAAKRVIENFQRTRQTMQQLERQTQTLNRSFTSLEIERVAQRMGSLENVLNSTRQGMNGFGVITQQAGYQIGDFIVQVQSGTSAFVAFGQQATQMVGFLPLLAAEMGKTSLKFMGLNLSMGAITLGLSIIIPLLTAVGAAWMRTSEETSKGAKQQKDAYDQLRESLNEYIKAKEAAAKGITEDQQTAVDKLKEASDKLIASRKELEIAQAGAQIGLAQGGAGLATGAYVASLIGINQAQDGITVSLEEQAKVQETINQLRDKMLDSYEQESQSLAYTNQLELAKLLNGEKSVEYKRLVAEEERRNYEESLRSLDVSEGYIQALLYQYDQMVKNREEATKQVEEAEKFKTKVFESLGALESMAKVNLSNVFANAMPAAQTFLDKVLEISRAYAKYGPSGVIPGTAIPRGKFTEDGMTAAARGEMASRPSPFGRVAGGAAGYAKDTSKKSGAKEKQDPLEKLKEQLALENELIGATEAQQRVFKALGEDRSKYSQKEIDAITAEIDAYNVKMETIKQQEQLMNKAKSALEDGFMAMVDGTMSVKDAFKSMARDIIKELYRVLVVQRMVGAISGAVNMFSLPSGPSTGTLGLPKFASGGSMLGGNAYLVGEHGPELVVPRHSGTVVNANQTANALGGDSGGFTQNLTISVTGSDAAMVRAEVAKMIPQITNATKAAVIDAKQRGGQMAAAFR